MTGRHERIAMVLAVATTIAAWAASLITPSRTCCSFSNHSAAWAYPAIVSSVTPGRGGVHVIPGRLG